MILRSITKHVKDQNWFAVVLDFVIVVVGILIAFQITNWSEARQDKLIYDQARTRVIEEAQVNVNFAQDFIIRAENYKQAARDIIEDFATCSTEDGAEDRLMTAIQSLRFIISMDVRDDAIHLMLSSDAFLDNISPTDRKIFSVYAQKIGRLAENLKFSDSYQLSRQSLQDIPIFKRIIDTEITGGLVGINLNSSYSEACKNLAFNTFLFDRLENATYVLVQAERLAKAAIEVLIGLGERPAENNAVVETK